MPCRPSFDSAGDLWAANYNGSTVVEFTKAQLAKSGSPKAWVTISGKLVALNSGSVEFPREGLVDPGDVAVDPTGDLWVTDAGNTGVVEFAKAQLAKSGSPKPSKVISGPATGLNWPWSIAIEP
jgi:hypothetical protein